MEVSPSEGCAIIPAAMKWNHINAFNALLTEEDEAMESLLRSKSSLGESCLQVAVRANQGGSIALMLKWLKERHRGADVAALFQAVSPVEGCTPILCALKWNHNNALYAMLQHNEGIDSALHHKSDNGENSLILAARHNNGQSIRVLITTLREKGFTSGALVLAEALSPMHNLNASDCAKLWNHVSASLAIAELFPK